MTCTVSALSSFHVLSRFLYPARTNWLETRIEILSRYAGWTVLRGGEGEGRIHLVSRLILKGRHWSIGNRLFISHTPSSLWPLREQWRNDDKYFELYFIPFFLSLVSMANRQPFLIKDTRVDVSLVQFFISLNLQQLLPMQQPLQLLPQQHQLDESNDASDLPTLRLVKRESEVCDISTTYMATINVPHIIMKIS